MPIGDDFVKSYQETVKALQENVDRKLMDILEEAGNWIQEAYTKGYEHGLCDGSNRNDMY